MGAAADCELIGPGFLGQPVNSSTSLTLCVAGLVLVYTRRRPWVGIALIAAGVGSFLFHGPLAPGGDWVHDVTLAWLILVVGTQPRNWGRHAPLPALVALGALFAVAPGAADWITVTIFVVAVASLIAHDRSPATRRPLVLLGAAAIIGRLGSTGWPLCDPGSLLQTHGVWHVGAAVAVSWWAFAENRHARVSASEPSAR